MDLKLARLPERTPVKIAISVSPDLAAALADYAAIYEKTLLQRFERDILVAYGCS